MAKVVKIKSKIDEFIEIQANPSRWFKDKPLKFRSIQIVTLRKGKYKAIKCVSGSLDANIHLRGDYCYQYLSTDYELTKDIKKRIKEIAKEQPVIFERELSDENKRRAKAGEEAIRGDVGFKKVVVGCKQHEEELTKAFKAYGVTGLENMVELIGFRDLQARAMHPRYYHEKSTDEFSEDVDNDSKFLKCVNDVILYQRIV